MKKILFLFFLTFLFNNGLKAQVMHSSNAMEYSIGVERFAQFVVLESNSLILGTENQPKQDLYRGRVVVGGRYKKFQDIGNYYALGTNIGYSSWDEEAEINAFIGTGLPVIVPTIERNRETKLGFFYQYAFLINKDKKSDLHFFIGGATNLYATFARKVPRDLFFNSTVKRDIVAARISLVPELMYFVPNSRVTLSLRALTPLVDMQWIEEEFRASPLNSFSGSSIGTSDFRFAAIGRSRIELGFGYFLKIK